MSRLYFTFIYMSTDQGIFYCKSISDVLSNNKIKKESGYITVVYQRHYSSK